MKYLNYSWIHINRGECFSLISSAILMKFYKHYLLVRGGISLKNIVYFKSCLFNM